MLSRAYPSASASVNISDDTTTNATRYLNFTAATSGTETQVYTSSSKLYFNPNSGALSASSFNSLSDANLKQNVEDLVDFSVLNQIRPVSYDWIDGSGHAYGVIAQEVEQVLPELVETNEDGIKSVSYTQLIPFMIAAIKSLQEEVAELKSQI